MTLAEEQVEHPAWCDRTRCTAPEKRPTEYVPGKMGAHESAVIELEYGRVQAQLRQSVTRWDTDVFLELQIGTEKVSIGMGDGGAGGMELYALLGQGVGGLVQKWPALYAERFPHLVEGGGA